MSQGKPEARIKWLSFRCPSCRAQLRIKAAYASMRGRCPECGSRIEALRPAPSSTPSAPSLAGEPGDLVPIEDEWPEPALVKDEQQPGGYGFAATPPTWPEPPAPAPPKGQGYDFATGDLQIPPPPAPELSAESFAAEQPSPESRPSPVLPSEFQKELDLLHQPPPPPPPFPMWSGLYTFPWREGNRGVWFCLGLNFSILALIAAVMALILQIGGLVLIAIPLLLPVMGFIFFWTGIYASGCFLAAVEDTAAGNDQVTWPKGGGLVDGLGKLAFFVWLGGCSLIPVGIFWVANGGLEAPHDFTWVWAVLPGLVLFPVQLLSVLTVGSWWAILDRRIIIGLLTTPRALLLMCLPPLVLIVPCTWLAQQIALRGNLLLAVAAGFVWSAFMLVYARILGRTGWLLIGTGAKRKTSKKKSRQPRLETTQAGWGDTPDQSGYVSRGAAGDSDSIGRFGYG
jgi:hypothetical protein